MKRICKMKEWHFLVKKYEIKSVEDYCNLKEKINESEEILLPFDPVSYYGKPWKRLIERHIFLKEKKELFDKVISNNYKKILYRVQNIIPYHIQRNYVAEDLVNDSIKYFCEYHRDLFCLSANRATSLENSARSYFIERFYKYFSEKHIFYYKKDMNYVRKCIETDVAKKVNNIDNILYSSSSNEGDFLYSNKDIKNTLGFINKSLTTEDKIYLNQFVSFIKKQQDIEIDDKVKLIDVLKNLVMIDRVEIKEGRLKLFSKYTPMLNELSEAFNV